MPVTLFLDTNILLRHLLGDHPEQSPQSTAFLERVERGEIRVRTAPTVLFETVFTLERHYRHTKEDIRDAVVPLLQLPGIVITEKRQLVEAFDLYVDHNLPFADAYHASMMMRLGITRIVSFDRHFERIPGIERVEPSSLG